MFKVTYLCVNEHKNDTRFNDETLLWLKVKDFSILHLKINNGKKWTALYGNK